MLKFFRSTINRALVLALIANTILTLLSLNTLTHDQYWVIHTHEVARVLEDQLGAIKDIESGVRGMVITNDRAFLDAYDSGLTKLPAITDEFAELTSDNIRQQERVPQMRLLIRDKLALARNQIQAKETNDPNLVKLIRDGKDVMDRFRIITGQAQAEESRLLKARQANLTRAYRLLQCCTAVFDLLILGALSFSLAKQKDQP